MTDETQSHQNEVVPASRGAGASSAIEEPRASSRKGIYIAIGVLVGALLITAIIYWAMHRGEKTETLAEQEANQRQTVSVAVPGRVLVENNITTTGSLAARYQIPVSAVGQGGRITQVFVNQGDWVRAGQVMATIDRSVQVQQSAALASQIQSAQSDLRLAQINLDRGLQLVDRGFISKAQIDQLYSVRNSARARLNTAQAQYGEARASNAFLNIVAPQSGLVLTRTVEPGQVASAGAGSLFTIASGGQMELAAQVNEADLAGLSRGVSAVVTPTGSTQQFAGQIWQIAPTIDQKTRQGTAKIALSYNPALRPGGFATAIIRAGAVQAPLLPESAILNDTKGSYVFIVDSRNRAVRRDVQIGTVTQNGIAVISGLDGTERVVLRAGGFLSPGEVVNVKLVRIPGQNGPGPAQAAPSQAAKPAAAGASR